MSATPGPSDNTSQTGEQGSTQKEQQEQKTFTFSYGIIMLRTKKLLNFLDTLAEHKTFLRMGWVFLGITIVSAAVMIWLMLFQTYILLNSSLNFRCFIGAAPASQCVAHGITPGQQISVLGYLTLPGINPYIPLIYGIIGIAVAIIVHEGMHGVIARALKLPVKSTGLLFFLIVPIGAFVEVDEKMVQKARFRDSGRIMAGGPGTNVVVALVALALLLLLIGGLAPTQFNGVYVTSVISPSPAENLFQQGHLHSGDLILAVNGTAVHTPSDLSTYLETTRPNETISLSIEHQGQVQDYTIVLAKYPEPNVSKGFIGILQPPTSSDLLSLRNNYTSSFFTRPTLYLLIPGIYPQADSILPFSSSLSPLYTSPSMGAAWYPIALTLFWIWLLNITLAIFNAIPLYPLDGGQALLNFFSHFGKKGVEDRAMLLTKLVSFVMLALLVVYIALPRILSVIPI